MTNSSQIHSVSIRFDLTTKEKVEELFQKTQKHFSAENKKEGAWFVYNNEEMLNLFRNYFNYIYECFGNFIDNEIDSETCLDIAVLELSEELFKQTDMILFYQGKIGGDNTISYVLRDEKCDVFSVKEDIKDYEGLAEAIQYELEFLNFAASIQADVIRNFKTIRLSFETVKKGIVTLENMKEILSEQMKLLQ